MKVLPDFENELKSIDPRLTVVQNPNRKELCNIKLDGFDVCPIPSGDIFDEYDKSYGYVAPNGYKLAHKSRLQALAQVKDTLERIKDPEFYKIFFNQE